MTDKQAKEKTITELKKEKLEQEIRKLKMEIILLQIGIYTA